MAARKKLVTTICIVSLILVITAGVLLSVGSQTNSGTYNGAFNNGVNLASTGLTVNAGTATSGVSNDKPADATDDAVAISNQNELGTFLGNSVSYGYITADFGVNWSGAGTSYALAQGKTINGNGHTITLSDDTNGTANQYHDSLGGSNVSSGGTYTGGMDYGMFVAYNAGTIQNIKFKYDQALTIKNDSGNIIPNYAGLICGTNAPTGVIQNCDLNANGSFRFEYNNGSLAIDDKFPSGDNQVRRGFTISFGGIAGRNAGKITNITTNYTGSTNVSNYLCFDVSLNVTAANKSGIWGQRANANAYAGGISGLMYSNASEICNIVLTGNLALYLAPTANQNTGISERAGRIAIAAAVVGANSAYAEAEGGIGEGAANQGKVDNIIQAINVRYSGKLGKSPSATSGNPDCSWPSEMSDNATVFCGKATNVTLLEGLSSEIKSSQNAHLQTDHCNCGVGGNAGNHETGYGNLIHVDDNSDVSVGMVKTTDEYGELVYSQQITASPKNSSNYMLGEFTFTKNMGKNEDADAEGNTTGLQTSNGVDTSNPYGVPRNDTTYLYTMEDVRQSSYTVTVAPYQSGSAKYWEVDVTAYKIVNIGENDNIAHEYIYNGFDFLTTQLKYTAKDNSASGVVAPSGFNAIAEDEYGLSVTSGRLPGTYTFKLQEKEAGLSYINKDQRVVCFTADTIGLDPFTFTVINAQMQIQDYTPEWLAENWLAEVTDFNFELVAPNVQEGAANGYVYEVNGSEYPRSGLTLTNDTSTTGRTYTVYLTSGGVQVTDPLTYTVRVDLDNPVLKIPHYEHSDGRYYTHNRVYIDASDEHSGIASIMMYNLDADGNTIGDPVDVIYECRDNSEENDMSYIDEETGYYAWYFSYSERIVIVVTDVAGQISYRELNVNIDNFKPEISVSAYFFDSMADTEGNVTTTRRTYTNGLEVYSAVYFDATATFGESGGVIQYSYDNVNWTTYTETLVVKVSSDIYFRALSNAFDHHDTYPYKKMYQVDTYWSQNLKNDGDMIVTSPFKVNVEVEHVAITLDDVVIENTTKEFDGTNVFKGTISAKPQFAALINGDIIFTVTYADINAGEQVALNISARCTDNAKVLENQFDEYFGTITKKEISVVINNQEKEYGYGLPELTYTQSGMIAGFEEPIQLYVVKGEGYENYTYELLPQSKSDPQNPGYDITVAEGVTFTNYVLPAGNITKGKLQVAITKIDRLSYVKGEFTGLDTVNIATRNLEIGFIRVTGVYEKLTVQFYRRVYDETSGTITTNWERQRDMKNAPAGVYQVRISLPTNDASGEPLGDKYYLDSSVSTFLIKVIDAKKFELPNETEEYTEEAEGKNTQSVPTVSNNNAAQTGDYEGNKTTTENTDTQIESPAKKTRDYLAMVSIFCAVIIAIAFAFGVGKAVVKRSARR